jgi:hypothetical protein
MVKRFVRAPRWTLMFAFGRFRPVSSAVVFFYGRPVVQPRPEQATLFPDVDVESVVTAMRRDGLYAGINLPPETVAEIVEFANTTKCYWALNRDVQFLPADRAAAEERCGAPILLGRYLDIADRCDVLRLLPQDPMLRYIAARYLGSEPGQTETRLWWSFVGDATPDERLKADQGFHYDLHDFRSIAFFFHLTDVDLAAGPHVSIKGSHVNKPWRMLLGDTRQATDAELTRRYGADNLVTLCGPAGFGFAADPFAYHKGMAPESRDRLMLRIRFTVFDDGFRVDRTVADDADARGAT